MLVNWFLVFINVAFLCKGLYKQCCNWNSLRFWFSNKAHVLKLGLIHLLWRFVRKVEFSRIPGQLRYATKIYDAIDNVSLHYYHMYRSVTKRGQIKYLIQ